MMSSRFTSDKKDFYYLKQLIEILIISTYIVVEIVPVILEQLLIWERGPGHRGTSLHTGP